jgi:hypothetical protein
MKVGEHDVGDVSRRHAQRGQFGDEGSAAHRPEVKRTQARVDQGQPVTRTDQKAPEGQGQHALVVQQGAVRLPVGLLHTAAVRDGQVLRTREHQGGVRLRGHHLADAVGDRDDVDLPHLHGWAM